MFRIDKEKRIYFASLVASKLINARKKPVKSLIKRILIIRLDEIGDMVVSLPAIDLLIAEYPNSEIVIWCRPLAGTLLKGKPGISQIVHSQKELKGKFDAVVELRGNWETLKYALKNRPKYRLDRGLIRFKNKFANSGVHPHEVITAVQIVSPLLSITPENPVLTIHIPQKNKHNAELFLQRNVISDFSILHIGAGKALRRWSLANFIQTAKWLYETKSLEVVFVGSSSDLNQIEKIQKNLGFKTFGFVADYSLLDYAALSTHCKIMIGNESGPMHISAASGAPVIALFGPGEPHIFRPWSDKALVLHHKLECNPCNQIDCVLPLNPCINHITLDEVKQAVEKLVF